VDKKLILMKPTRATQEVEAHRTNWLSRRPWRVACYPNHVHDKLTVVLLGHEVQPARAALYRVVRTFFAVPLAVFFHTLRFLSFGLCFPTSG